MLLPSALPGSLSISGAGGSLYTTTGFRWVYAINDLPFLSGASRQYPIVRESAPSRKQQFDAAESPGEQTLSGWWLRSQTSFHGGAGQIFLDRTTGDEVSFTRFHSSRNVDVWEQGTVTLLQAAKKAGGSPVAALVDATEITFTDGTHAALGITAAATHIVTSTGVTTAAWTASAKALQSVTTDGSYVYVVSADGVYAAAIPSTPGAFTWAKEYTVTTPPDLVCHLAFVKSRLMLGAGKSVYELPPHPVGPPVALPTANYTHTVTGWHWTGFTELGPAIYAIGNNGVRGSIIKFILSNTTGAVPTLSGGAVAAQLPSGEVVYSALGYMGAFMGLGTSAGVRVATADGNGDLTYGPLLFGSTTAIRGWSARDRFLYCAVTGGIDGDSGVYRIDLSTEVAALRFAYATDLSWDGDSTDCAVVCHLGSSDILAFGTGTDTYITDTANLAAEGYIRTSRIRFGTLEPKSFAQIKTRGPSLAGGLSVQILDQYDNAGSSYTYTTQASPGESDISITSPAVPQDFVSVKYTLTRSSGTPSTGAEMWGYQLRALPVAMRQRMIQVPLLCFDWERDSLGNRRGSEGSAMLRLFNLEDLEQDASVMFQDLSTGETAQCAIEQIRFMQDAPPTGMSGFGGVILLTLRTL